MREVRGYRYLVVSFFFQAEDGIRDYKVTGVQTCALPIFLAGGQATRLRPLTDRIPKALVDVAGRPFLWHQLELLKHHGARRVVLAVGYLGKLIQEHFGDGSEMGIELQYSFDGPVLLGTGGAIRQALHL